MPVPPPSLRRFGSEVTIIQMLSKLMGHEDDDIAEAVAEILREDGIDILLENVGRQSKWAREIPSRSSSADPLAPGVQLLSSL